VWIAAGRVTVQGRIAALGDRAGPRDRIEVDGRPVRLRAPDAPARVLVYHKPVGELVTRRDPGGRATVFERLPKLRHSQWISIGRLDLNTSGLLLFTDSGELANRLMHPRYEIEREYAVRVLGTLSDASRRRLLRGVMLEDGKAAFATLEPMRASNADAANQWYRVMLREGRTREVRRLFEVVGATVSRLTRVRFAGVRLPPDLHPGKWIELDATACATQLGQGRARKAGAVVRGSKSC
jgi:23S rRNA pseudouridine2605 synthase